MERPISIKGTREGLTVTLGLGDLTVLLEDLSKHLETQGAFFRGGRVALRVGDRDLAEADLSRITALLTEHEMILRTVVTTNETTERAVKALGLRLVTNGPPQDDATLRAAAERASAASQGGHRRPHLSSPVSSLEESKGILIHHLVRSGQVVRHTGHIVVIGDVNTGAEVIAGGDIVVWGRLLGTAHAGAMGRESAVICAIELSPLQLHIGDLVARAEENDGRKKPCPEVAYVRDNMIVVEPWDGAARGA